MPTMMRHVILLAAAILSAQLPGTAHAALPSEINGQPLPSLAGMLERVTPSVVNITTEGHSPAANSMLNDPFFKRFLGKEAANGGHTISGTGSGVIIQADQGHVLTNAHVIEDADKINVTLVDGRKFTARVMGVDPRADLAVLQIPADHLVAMRFSDSDRLRVGDFVVAIGNPYGIGQTVTSGIISAMHRNPGISEYENFIQTDAPINLGNSGGPLVNLHGELVGINTAILGDQGGGSLGIGFAVPINTAASVINQIVRFGHVERGQLGIEVGDIEPEMIHSLGLKSRVGAVVAEVIPGSAAARAGIQANDVIIRLNGFPVGTAKDVKNRIGNLPIGARVKIDLAHAGNVRSVTAVIGRAGDAPPKNPHEPTSQSVGDKPSWERNF